MISEAQLDDVMGATLFDQDGDKIGRVGQIYVDDESGDPSWMTVNTGFFGTSESFVPFDRAELTDGGVRVPFTKAVVKSAPHAAEDGHLDEAEQDELHRYYAQQDTRADDGHLASPSRLQVGAVGEPAVAASGSALTDDAPVNGARASDDAGSNDEDAHRGRHAADVPVDQPPVEHADHAHVVEGSSDEARGGPDREPSGSHDARATPPSTPSAGTTPSSSSPSSPPQVGVTIEDGAVIDAPSGRMRLRRYVVTEQRTITVPVTHEEVRLEPVDDEGSQGSAGADEVDVRHGAHS